MAKKIIIVGGVAGGASTAARLRRNDEQAEIIMFERGDYISFANCGLPYYIGGAIKNRKALLVQTPEAMKARFNLDIRVNSEVIEIDRKNKMVKVKNVKTNDTYVENYDKLVLSPGSTPLRPPITGIDKDNIFTLWNIPDTDKVKTYVDTHDINKAAVIGGGFIGIEMAENLVDRGIEVTLIELADQVLAPFDFDMAQLAHRELTQKGVKLILGDGVNAFLGDDFANSIRLNSGKVIETDMVMLSIGVKPNGELAKMADLETNARGGIVVDEYMQTSDNDIYALGDAVEIIDYNTGGKGMVPLAGPANKQGRIVANNLCDKKEKYTGTQGTAIVKVFDLTAASTGLNEKALQKMDKKYGVDYHVTIVLPQSHASYYPGATPMTLKMIFDNNGKVLGAQIIGYEGVDKRIDVIATAIRFGGTIDDLRELELAYAPPFSSAKDPVNMAGFSANNILSKQMNATMWHEIESVDLNTTTILDVRDAIEREGGYVEGSVNIPVNDLRERWHELDKDKDIIVYCAVGIRAYIALRILKANGFNARNMLGGYRFYQAVTPDYRSNDQLDTPKQEKTESKPALVQEEDGTTVKTMSIDACGLQCPGPIMEVYQTMKTMKGGEKLEISATDPGFPIDAKAWCEKTGNYFLGSEKTKDAFVVTLEKSTQGASQKDAKVADGKSMVVFSGDLDKAIASFIIANGAAAMGKPVTMFFTFWGLNILRKPEKVNVKKTAMEKMFGAMMPRGTEKLGLSKMNMGGMGTAMMKKIMKDKNVNSLEELIQSAMNNGVRIVACTMSMDVMGIKREELIDGVEIGGVAAYLGAADDSNVNLFI